MRIKISSEKTADFLKSYHYGILGIILVIFLTFNAIAYYQYVYLTMNIKVDPDGQKVLVDKDTLDKIMESVDERENNLKRIEAGAYKNPFR